MKSIDMDVMLTRRIVPAAEKKDFKPLALDSLISGLPHLPAAFQIVPRLLLLLDDPEADCEGLAEIIRIDPGLTAAVFRLSNSASFRGAQRAASLTEAILRLGMRQVYRLVMEIVTAATLKSPDAFAFGRIDLWRHSLATAVAAHTLAPRLTREDPEVAFTAGLLHDIGKALLARASGPEYFDLLTVCAETNRPVHAAEQEAFRTDHTEAAGRLLRAWKFPEGIVAAVAGHHWPVKLGQDFRPLATVVYAANILAYRIGQGNGVPVYAAAPDEAALRILDIDDEGLTQYEEEVTEMLRREEARLH